VAGRAPRPQEDDIAMITLNFAKSQEGLIPAIVQDWQTGEVLMLAYLNAEAWKRTLETGKATYWSRSRQSFWVKGESSGNVQWVKEILIDCDEDTVVLKVDQVGGAACHEGYRTCFFRKVEGGELKVVGERVFDPKTVYKK
jgi:phosphoribosyl-AMP cyclohydrolase